MLVSSDGEYRGGEEVASGEDLAWRDDEASSDSDVDGVAVVCECRHTNCDPPL